MLKGENMEDRYLFKAKDCNSIWRAGLLIALQEGRCAIEEKDGSKWACDSETLCQCTGLKDKNGNLIWENDIIKTFDAGEEWCLSKIIFADTSLGCGWKTTDIKSLSKYNNNLFKEVSFGSFDSKSVEVVGNIFDSPELLESEEK